jgi:predicted kinase
LPRIVIACGLPGSGKSSFLRALGVTAISSDEVRLLLADDPTIQTIHGQVFATMRYLVRRRLALGRPATYVDATHLTPPERAPWIAIARAFGAEAEALFFDTPADLCKERNRSRSRVVPEEAIDMLAAKLIPPSLAEGFHHITVVK